MILEVRHLRTLRALHQCGTLAKAAERLHVTQSALSHQLKDLEQRLEVRLYHRKGKPLRFTPAGERLLKLAERVLPEMECALAELQRMREGESGRLHIAIECHSCFEWLMPAMDAYRADWPEVEMDVTLAYSFEPLPALVRGDLDLVITSDPQPLPGVVYHPLFRFQGVLVMANGHPLTRKSWIEPTDLRDETLITYPVPTRRLDIYRHFLEPAGVAPAERRTAELTLIILQLVASRRGVAALPDWAVHEHLERGYVSARPMGRKGMWGTLYCAFHEGMGEAPYLRAFLDTARTISFQTLRGIRPVEDKQQP